MDKNVFYPLFAFLILLYFHDHVQGVSFEDMGIRRQLRVLNKTPIKTIKTRHGDVIDCVDAHNQPAFDHPLLKNHKLQMRPSSDRVEKAMHSEHEDSVSNMSKIVTNGISCPDGTVPIRRTLREELVYSQQFLKDHQGHSNRTYYGNQQYTFYDLILSEGRSHRYHGARGRINTWPLKLDRKFASSVGMYLYDSPDTIHAGWMVNPTLFGDSKSRLYAAWSNGGNTGCTNTLCPGFVQVHRSMALGSVVSPLSVRDGQQNELNLEIYMEGGSWWLRVNGQAIGYWPLALFPLMGLHANEIGWGGTTRLPAGATYIPPMGSGAFAAEKYGRACYVRDLQVKNLTHYHPPDRDRSLHPVFKRFGQTYFNCFTIKDGGHDTRHDWRRHLYVGGPGCKRP